MLSSDKLIPLASKLVLITMFLLNKLSYRQIEGYNNSLYTLWINYLVSRGVFLNVEKFYRDANHWVPAAYISKGYARILTSKKAWIEASLIWESVSNQFPLEREEYRLYVGSLVNSGDVKKAISVLSEAIEDGLDSPGFRFRRAKLLMQVGAWIQAEVEWCTLLESADDDRVPFYYCVTLHALGREKEAVSFNQKFLDPDNSTVFSVNQLTESSTGVKEGTDQTKEILSCSKLHSQAEDVDLQVSPPAEVKVSEYYIYKSPKVDRPATSVYTFENSYLTIDARFGYRYNYYLFSSSGTYLPEMSHGDLPSMVDAVRIDETVALIEDRHNGFNICHFLLDKLTRASEFSKFNPDTYLLFRRPEYVCQVANYLGLHFTEVGDLTGVRTFRFNRLLVSDSASSQFRHPGQNLIDRCITNLDRLNDQIPITNQSPKKIFIDRKSARTRRIINDDEVRKFLSAHGFEFVQLELLTFEQQVSFFSQAEIVVGVHGAGLTNIGFCQATTTVVFELLPAMCATSAFWKLACAKGLQYRALVCEDPSGEKPDYSTWIHNSRLNGRDIIVPMQSFMIQIESILSKFGEKNA